MSRRANYYHLNRPAIEALAGVNNHTGSIEPALRALIELRVSQINGCVYCVDLHTMQARTLGEAEQRLDTLCVWRECPFFTERERAAFGWAESLTAISSTGAPDSDYEALAPHFSEQEIVDLTFIIATMNAMNRVAIGHRKLPALRGT